MFAARTFLFKQVLVKKEQKKAMTDNPPSLSFASKACLVPMAGFEDIAFNAFDAFLASSNYHVLAHVHIARA
jgi:hypothetical protein